MSESNSTRDNPANSQNASEQSSSRGNAADAKPPSQADAVRKMDIAELLNGLTTGSKNQKDMTSYKFWQTQPVPKFDEKESQGGPIKVIDPEKVSKEPDALLEGFEWTTLDLTNKTELHELWDLLTNHYVEDDNAMFRFRYSESFLHWCVSVLMSFTGIRH